MVFMVPGLMDKLPFLDITICSGWFVPSMEVVAQSELFSVFVRFCGEGVGVGSKGGWSVFEVCVCVYLGECLCVCVWTGLDLGSVWVCLGCVVLVGLDVERFNGWLGCV